MDESARQKLVAKGIDPSRIPRHIGIIMDGNGRWAQSRGLSRIQGHHAGYQRAKEIIRIAGRIGVDAVTLYTFSVENWRRPEAEVQGLMTLIAEAALAELNDMISEGVQMRLSGRIEALPRFVREALQTSVEQTKSNTGLILNLAVNYGGRAEVVDACRRIAAQAVRGEIDPQAIDEEMISRHLYQPDLPEPDLLVRTAGEKRISNFLLWQSAYAEIHVTEAPWPEFDVEALYRAILDYQGRVRKFGAVMTDTETS